MTLERRLEARQQRKLLAIDGGGIRGVLALEILRKVEADLREKIGNKDVRLADYFDFIGGTSTGAIIAAGLAKGANNDVATALALLTQAISLDSADASLYLARGALYLSSGRPGDARTDYSAAVSQLAKASPKDPSLVEAG